MFFHPSRVFPLQWPLSGTMQLTVMCNITLTFSRSAAALIVTSLLYSCKGTSARICLSSKPICTSLDFTAIPDPDLSLQAAIKMALNAVRSKLYKCACSRWYCWRCMQKRLCFFSESEPLKNKVAFMLCYCRLSCFDRFLELRSNQVSPYIANVEGSEIPQDLSFSRRGEPRALVPKEGSSKKKKDWLSMDGREAWQSVPKEASLGRRRICRGCVWKHWQLPSFSLSLQYSILLYFRPTGESNRLKWSHKIP